MITVRINQEEKKFPVGTKICDILEPPYFACKINGKLKDISSELKDKDEVELLDFSSNEGREIFWHSSAHLLAHALKRIFPKAKLGTGPAIEEGFYYDFELKNPLSEKDLTRIEEEMRNIVKENIPIQKKEYSVEKGKWFYKFLGEDYKLELLSEIETPTITFYKQKDFVDLCKGPHLPSTGYMKEFKLLSVTGAYWRGDENNPMLQRVYGISFPTEQQLTQFLKKREEAKKRDHRILGRELELFEIHEEIGPGLVTWLPKGDIIRKEIEELWIEEHIKEGYQIVHTPHIAKAGLWRLSGHYDYYKENMFFFKLEDAEYVLRPMNCPGHILIYNSKKRSYKELPIKLAELGTVYRNERSGVLHGMLRVRGFTIDDAHIFCTPEQIEEEISKILDLSFKLIKNFGYENFKTNLSLREKNGKGKYVGEEEDWEKAEEILEKVLTKKLIDFKRKEGEAAFYGPKIDIELMDALGRPWQGPTIQLDFALPKRFNLTYIGRDGKDHRIALIHRAIFGAIERFIGGLIEHYGGFFPLWLSPYQVAVMTVTDEVLDYAIEVAVKLIDNGIRIITQFENEKIANKIRKAEEEKIPYMVIIGKKEKEKGYISVRKKKEGIVGERLLDDFILEIKAKIKERR